MSTRSISSTTPPPRYPLAVQTADRIRVAADRAERSLAYTARKIEMSRDAFMRRMRGEREWSLHELASIADALGCEPSDLLPDTFKPTPRRPAPLRAA